ncbi:MAG: 3-deoxy-manno-octulosonate cytidylyltransferase [Elusimicrobiales bacterium]
MKVCAIIPARYSSTRFPGKVIHHICGKPLIVWVWERVIKIDGIDKSLVATDDERVKNVCDRYGITAVITSPTHRSGTDRIAEVARKEDADIYINIQGDEPFITPYAIKLPLKLIESDLRFDITTAVTPLKDQQMISDQNIVKAVVENKRVIYFSRLAVPYHHNLSETKSLIPYYRHIGVYVFRKESLFKFVDSPPSLIETLERLEQLRALACGMSIGAEIVDYSAPSIDTPHDIAKAERFALDNSLI